jgi:hypothetical protein
MPKADIKTKKFRGIYYPKATFPTLSVSGELQASRL